MENELRLGLESLVTSYATAVGKARTTVAHAAIGSDRFFSRLDAGGTFTVRVYDAAVQWFSDRWPDGLAWPEGVARPARSVVADEGAVASAPASEVAP